MKIKRNNYILSISLIILLILLIVAVLLLVQGSGSDKEHTIKDLNTTDIPTIPTSSSYQLSRGETKTFDNVFWVFSTRYETLNWEICDISFDTGVIVNCNPSNGIIYAGDAPTSVSVTVTEIGKANRYDGNISICRVGDPYDKETIDIIIIVS